MSSIGLSSIMISATVAAEMIGTYSKQIRRLILRGELPGAYRLSDESNAPYIIPLESVTAYIAKQKAEKKTRRGQAQ